ncbi:hypothetical protein GPECTOR_19g329 [Gonium pectorale]|uniref:mannan endo-1,4-beta-mannosidase n=1 Tax=Gonium pectorale TaxID=33097 RepID=A0A150GJ90_GONPE|nr:hypothetical protein GPECTOR_19g329 [Gonium pectorale]|eukprot:KXZ49878.1 hypothetical protein GPECTOR_19g329 [Gonium pectorale]
MPPQTARNVSQAFTHITPDLQLERDCRRVVLVGFNAYDMASMALVTPTAFRTQGGRSGREAIGAAFRAAARRGHNVARVWAHSSDPKFPFQVAPGVYLEAALAGLDWVVADAAAAGLQLVLSFVDNWKYYNGMDQYVDWSSTAPPRTQPRPADVPGDPAGLGPRKRKAAGTSAAPGGGGDGGGGGMGADGPVGVAAADPYEAHRHSLFFSDPGSRELFRSHIATIVNRRNTYTGRLYRDEPAILAWNLANEPRCEAWANKACNHILQEWIVEMSAHVRQLDPNHLITIGSEGFFGPSTPDLLPYNPGGWAAELGQDFVANNAAPHIDYATVHLWPDNWESGANYANFLNSWLASHLAAASVLLHKPVLLEEFGKKVIRMVSLSGIGRWSFPLRTPPPFPA